MQFDDAQDIVRQLGGVWHGTFGMVLCPSHADRNPSLSIAQGHSGPVFKCWAGCAFKDIMRALRAKKIDVVGRQNEAATTAVPGYSLSIVERIWAQAQPLVGTLGQRHLVARGLGMDHPSLRYSPAATFGPARAPRRKGPAIIVPMHFEGRLVGVQRVFLDPDGRNHHGLFKPVLCGERRAAMQLSPAGPQLAIAESWEDALAYRLLKGIPTWAVPGVEWLANTAIPDHVEELIIAFDRGDAAQSAFDRHSPRLAAPGRTIRFDPPVAADDWNADLNRLIADNDQAVTG